MRKIPLSRLAAAAVLAVTMHAQADTGMFPGFANGSQSVNFSLTAPNAVVSGSASAGGFLMSYNGGLSFEAYCVDVYQHISFGETYTDYGAPGTSHVFTNSNAYTDLGRLYATAGVVNNSVSEAAFQIAVWEIAYETTGGPYNLATGSATFSGGSADSSGALTLASSWLASLTNGAHPSIVVIESSGHQDVIYPPVPEPETYALMLAGLGAMGFVARRRRRS